MSAHPAEPEVWVVVASHDGGPTPNDDGPIVWETYTKGATRERAQRQAANLEKRYGPCRIARLVFDNEQPTAGDAGTTTSDSKGSIAP